jgi:uncharacterized DUF497 family protein
MGSSGLRRLDPALGRVGGMELEWDETKDAENLRKHRLPLAAAWLDWARAMRSADQRHDYGEERLYVIAPLEGRLPVCVYTLRAGRRRIISLRKANLRERRKCAAFIATTRG